ncbi:MAG: alanine racemase [Dethiosulfovibrio peptidovorans]|nr:MAG: alanine racemase [Dethiosulfovibrio peptidovorans]
MELHRAWMDVRLDNIRYNYRLLRQWLDTHGGQKARIFVVLKDNAYGLGAIPIAWTVKREGANFFIVAVAEEAMELREAGILDPVLVLGASAYDSAAVYVRHNIRASVSDLAMARCLSKEAVKQGKSAFIHIAVDTGMGRIGFSPEEARERIGEIARLPGIVCEGLFTHFSSADEKDLSYTEMQHKMFTDFLGKLNNRGIKFPMVHCCNSGATVNFPEWAMDGVRPGQLLVGFYPSPDVPRYLDLRTCFSLSTRVAFVKTLPPHEAVGYGRTYTTSSTETIAVLPIGYGDGFDRRLSNNADILLRGRRCPIVGRICMDQCMVRVDGSVEVGDEVTLIGRQGQEKITPYEFADRLGTIVTPVALMMGKRVKRLYSDPEGV